MWTTRFVICSTLILLVTGRTRVLRVVRTSHLRHSSRPPKSPRYLVDKSNRHPHARIIAQDEWALFFLPKFFAVHLILSCVSSAAVGMRATTSGGESNEAPRNKFLFRRIHNRISTSGTNCDFFPRRTLSAVCICAINYRPKEKEKSYIFTFRTAVYIYRQCPIIRMCTRMGK